MDHSWETTFRNRPQITSRLLELRKCVEPDSRTHCYQRRNCRHFHLRPVRIEPASQAKLMRFFTAISALVLSAMLSDSPSARAALLAYAGRLLSQSQGTECAAEKPAARVCFKASFLQSSRFVAAAAKPAGLERPAQVVATVVDEWATCYSAVPAACGSSQHAPHRSGSPPLA